MGGTLLTQLPSALCDLSAAMYPSLSHGILIASIVLISLSAALLLIAILVALGAHSSIVEARGILEVVPSRLAPRAAPLYPDPEAGRHHSRDRNGDGDGADDIRSAPLEVGVQRQNTVPPPSPPRITPAGRFTHHDLNTGIEPEIHHPRRTATGRPTTPGGREVNGHSRYADNSPSSYSRTVIHQKEHYRGISLPHALSTDE